MASLAAAAITLGGSAPPAPATTGPSIAPPSPIAQLSATRGQLVLDHACATVTVRTLPGNAACAARVARGETGPIIEVIVATHKSEPNAATVTSALPLLDRAIAAENHPAALYLAGALLTTGELVRPDYARGIPYLEKAAAGGNAAAADLLGSFVLEGRGTARDPHRAIRLFEQAAAGGMPGSGSRLGFLYLNNRYLPRDTEVGRRILKQASAAGDRDADAYLLALDGEALSHNYFIHPNADPAKVEVRDYKMLEIPEVSPGFGFTDEFRQIHYSPYTDPALLERLERDYASLPTPYLFELARRMAAVSPERALGYLLLARARLLYDIRRCVDPDTAEATDRWAALTARDLHYVLAGADQATLAAALRFAIDREAAMPGDSKPWWVCYGGLASFTSREEGKPVALRLVPEAQWPALRQVLRDRLAEALSSQSAH